MKNTHNEQCDGGKGGAGGRDEGRGQGEGDLVHNETRSALGARSTVSVVLSPSRKPKNRHSLVWERGKAQRPTEARGVVARVDGLKSDGSSAFARD